MVTIDPENPQVAILLKPSTGVRQLSSVQRPVEVYHLSIRDIASQFHRFALQDILVYRRWIEVEAILLLRNACCRRITKRN